MQNYATAGGGTPGFHPGDLRDVTGFRRYNVAVRVNRFTFCDVRVRSVKRLVTSRHALQQFVSAAVRLMLKRLMKPLPVRRDKKITELKSARGKANKAFAHGDGRALAAHRKFHRRQEALAGGRKSVLCVGTIVVLLTGYPPPNKVTQFRERRCIEELMSEFAAFATKLPRIPSHKVSAHHSINPCRKIRSIQSEEGIKRLFGIESLHTRMLTYKLAMSNLNLPIIHRLDATLYPVLDANRRGVEWVM